MERVISVCLRWLCTPDAGTTSDCSKALGHPSDADSRGAASFKPVCQRKFCWRYKHELFVTSHCHSDNTNSFWLPLTSVFPPSTFPCYNLPQRTVPTRGQTSQRRREKWYVGPYKVHIVVFAVTNLRGATMLVSGDIATRQKSNITQVQLPMYFLLTWLLHKHTSLSKCNGIMLLELEWLSVVLLQAFKGR